MRVTICGPNLNDQSKGTFHVHAADCADLTRGARREPEYAHGWTIEADSREAIVRNIYSDHIAEEERERAWMRANPEHEVSVANAGIREKPIDWHDYDDVHVFPCCNDLPDERPRNGRRWNVTLACSERDLSVAVHYGAVPGEDEQAARQEAIDLCRAKLGLHRFEVMQIFEVVRTEEAS